MISGEIAANQHLFTRYIGISGMDCLWEWNYRMPEMARDDIEVRLKRGDQV